MDQFHPPFKEKFMQLAKEQYPDIARKFFYQYSIALSIIGLVILGVIAAVVISSNVIKTKSAVYKPLSVATQIPTALLISPTLPPDSPIEKKRYFNPKWKYIIEYPYNWMLDESVAKGEGGCDGPIFYPSVSKQSWLAICPLYNPDGLEGVENSWKGEYRNLLRALLNGYPSISSEFQQFASQYEYNVVVETEDKNTLLWLQLITEISEKDNNKEIFDQILSSFSFQP
jgi:hypothetical protein